MSASVLKYIYIKGGVDGRVKCTYFYSSLVRAPLSKDPPPVLGTCRSGDPIWGPPTCPPPSWRVRDLFVLAFNSHCCVLLIRPKTSNGRHHKIIPSKYSLLGARLAKLARAQKLVAIFLFDDIISFHLKY